jgi:hypothetical protein
VGATEPTVEAEMGFLAWLRGGSPRSAGSVLGVFDEVFNPGAHRAREELERQHEHVVPTPSPGDRLLDDGVIVISVPEGEDEKGEAGS